jgi:hypothetical protein
VALADPDLPPGLHAPALRTVPPRSDCAADRHRRLREAFDAMPRRSRVIVALRLPPAGRRPLTLRAIGRLLGVGPERIRQLEQYALDDLSRAWLAHRAEGLTRDERVAELLPIIRASLDRYPIEETGRLMR